MHHIRPWLVAAGAALIASPVPAQERTSPAPTPTGTRLPDQQQAETLGYLPDHTTRMTVPVTIGGQGPYRFVVDTGAERTVISRELASELELGPGRTVRVHSMTEVSRIATVVLPGLQVGRRTVEGIQAPALARAHLGAPGMLGVDSLQRQRVVFDFARQEMTISPSARAEPRWPEGSIVVTGRRLFGRLVLVDAAVDGERVWVIIDTGSQVTIANSVLRERLRARRRLSALHPIQLTSITGGTVEAEYGVTRLIRIGGIDIRDLPIAFADVHPFRQLDLMDRPALLLGMDALHLFDRVSVDFANRRVRILLPEDSQLMGTQMAGAGRVPRVAS